MILIVTNSEDKTIDYFLRSVSNNHFRLNTDGFLTDYTFDFSKRWYIRNKKDNLLINQDRINGIYYRRPVLPQLDLKSSNEYLLKQLQNEFYDILDSFINSINIKYLNSKYDMIKAENKLIQLQIAKNIGFHIPQTIITNDKNKLSHYLAKNKEYCIKPLYLSYFELNGSEYIPYTAILKKSDYSLLTKCPVLIQEYIEKNYELRLTCVGDKIFPVKILSQANDNTKVDWRINNCSDVEYKKASISNDLKNMCYNLLSCFDLNFACMDLIVSQDNKVYFLDLNPNGQWAWLDELLNLGIAKKIERFFYE